MARQHPPPAHLVGGAGAAARRRPDRRHLEPDDLREGGQRLDRLRRSNGPAREGEEEAGRHALGADGRRHPGGGGHVPPGLRQDERPRRLRQHRGRADARQKHARHDQDGGGPSRPLQAAERDGEDPGHEGRFARHLRPDLQGPQHQHHPDLRRRALHGGGRGISLGVGEAAEGGRRPEPGRQRRQLFRQPGGHQGRQAADGQDRRRHRPPREAGARAASGQGRDRQPSPGPGGIACARRARAANGACGRAPPPRIRAIRTRTTSKS